jgi:hypothetical protein
MSKSLIIEMMEVLIQGGLGCSYVSSSGYALSADRVYARNGYDTTLYSNSGGMFLGREIYQLRHPTGPFPVSPVPALAGEVIHRYRL